MFGALLGTLQRFRTDEVKQKEKVRFGAQISARFSTRYQHVVIVIYEIEENASWIC